MEGQVLLTQVSALERGQILSLDEFRSAANAVASIASRFQGNVPLPLVGGDVQVVGKLLNQLVNQLVDQLVATMGFGAEGEEFLETFATATSDLLNPDLSSAWRSVVEGVEFDSEDFLLHLEAFSLVVAGQLLRNATDPQLVRDNLLITTVSHDQSHDSFLINFNETRSVVATEASSTTLLLTFGLFPTLGDLLPIRSLFNISQMTVATPILSVQAMEAGGSEVTNVSVTLTLPYRQPVVRVTQATCASWTTGEK